MVDFKPSTILHEGRPHVTGMTSVVPSRHEGDQFLAPQAVASPVRKGLAGSAEEYPYCSRYLKKQKKAAAAKAGS
jgi:hypothetical protein